MDIDINEDNEQDNEMDLDDSTKHSYYEFQFVLGIAYQKS